MIRRIGILALCFLFTMSVLVSAQSPDMTVLTKTQAVEQVLYGSEQSGSLVERINKLEKDIYGVESKDALIAKLDRIYSYVNEPSANQPSLIMKINAVEWTLTHNVSSNPVKGRIENLERIILGNSAAGSLDNRLTKLLQLAYTDGNINVTGTTISKDTLLKIKLTAPISSKTSRVGEAVSYTAAEDVYVGPVLAIAKGAQGLGKVAKVDTARNFGRDAKVEINFEDMQAVDGTVIQTLMGDKAKEETKSLAKAAGATVAGLVILGPVGILGGAFVHGQEINIPAGTEIYIQVKADTELYGITVK